MLLPKRHWSPEQNVIDTKLFGLNCHGEPKWSGADYEKARVHDLQYAALGLIERRNAPFGGSPPSGVTAAALSTKNTTIVSNDTTHKKRSLTRDRLSWNQQRRAANRH
jgi:hypothetical protein